MPASAGTPPGGSPFAAMGRSYKATGYRRD